MDGSVKNTDREIWRGQDEGSGDFYADSIHVTEQGQIGIDCGGTVIVMPGRSWHGLAKAAMKASRLHIVETGGINGHERN